MPNTQSNLLDAMFDLADMAGRPQCFCCVLNRTGQAGTLEAPPRDSGDVDGYAATACDVLLQDADLRDIYMYKGALTQAQVAKRLRIMAYVASVVVPPAVEDYDRRFALDVDADGYLPPLDSLDWAVTVAVTQLRGYLNEYDAGQWVDPNAMAGAVVDVHDAALAVETWWSLNPPAASAMTSKRTATTTPTGCGRDNLSNAADAPTSTLACPRRCASATAASEGAGTQGAAATSARRRRPVRVVTFGSRRLQRLMTH